MDSPSFKIVLQHVALERLVEVKRELSKRFEIDEDIASDIAGAAPIILLTDLTWDQAGAIRRRLWSIVEQGGRLVTTDAACDDIPKVNWPEIPDVATITPEEAASQAKAPPFREVASFRVPGFPDELKIVVAGAGGAPLPPLAAILERAPAPRPEPRQAPAAPTPKVVALPPVEPAQAAAPAPAPSLAPPADDSSRRIPIPPPPPPPHPPHHEASPFMRAVEAERERRASARLTAVAPPPPPPPPAPPPPPPSRRDAHGGLRVDDSDLYERPELPPLPVAGPGEAADDFGGFDIDEALRLLDNAPDAPAPAGAAAAPPPMSSPAPSPPARGAAPPAPAATFGGAASGLDFKEIESDVINLEAALERPAHDEDDLRPTAPAHRDPSRERRGGEPSAGEGPRRPGGRGAIAPLDPLEALSILESGKSPDSSEDVFSRQPSRPISDELEPLDPNEALAILQTQAIPVPAGAGAARGGGASAPTARRQGERRSFLDSGSSDETSNLPAAPAPASGKGGKGAAPERPSIVDSSDLDFDLDGPSPAAREEPVQPRVLPSKPATKSGMMKAFSSGSAPAPEAPPGVKGGGERPSIKRPSGPAARQPGDEEPVHGLVLSRITGEGRRHKAAEIIAELTSISKDEALKLTDRTIIPVLKGVSKTDAESALRRFERSKISGRVTTRRLGE